MQYSFKSVIYTIKNKGLRITDKKHAYKITPCDNFYPVILLRKTRKTKSPQIIARQQ